MSDWRCFKALMMRAITGYWPSWMPDEHLTDFGKRRKRKAAADQSEAGAV